MGGLFSQPTMGRAEIKSFVYEEIQCSPFSASGSRNLMKIAWRYSADGPGWRGRPNWRSRLWCLIHVWRCISTRVKVTAIRCLLPARRKRCLIGKWESMFIIRCLMSDVVMVHDDSLELLSKPLSPPLESIS
jgi:hypothetical protein